MGRRKVVETTREVPVSHPARSPETRENQLISLAYDLVEERLRNGTATSAETVAIEDCINGSKNRSASIC